MRRIIKSNGGFSLIEMVIVLGVFVVVMMITSSALKTVLTKGTVVQRSEESNIEGVVGLEMLRHDLAQAGLGLFTNTEDLPAYAEAVNTATSIPALYNDSGNSPNTPRPIVTDNNLLLADNVVLNATDYLSIKATTLGNNDAAQRWTYVESDGTAHTWNSNDFVVGDRMIALLETYDAKRGEMVRSLVKVASDNYEVAYINGTYDNYTPPNNMRYYFYGIKSAAGSAIRAPFNRADFYVRRPLTGLPTSCSPATGVLYKAVMSHADGTLTPEMPILDCVADMQIVLGWNTQVDPEKSNVIDVLSSANGQQTATPLGGSGLNGLNIQSVMQDPVELRKRLKQIKVYILAQDGARDPSFVNTNTTFPLVGLPPGQDNNEGLLVQRAGQAVPGSVDLTTPNMLNYRWKVYRVVVKPKNLG